MGHATAVGQCRIGDCAYDGRLIEGLCYACYCWTRSHPGEDPTGRRRASRGPEDGCCTVVEPDGTKCWGRHYGNGMCRRHWDRTRVHGTPHLLMYREEDEGAFLRAAAQTSIAQCILASSVGRPARGVWTIAHGDPGDLHVLHTCAGGSGSYDCVNVRHLYVGDGQPRTAARGFRKLTADQVREIRSTYRPGLGVVLAQRFGVSRPTISRIIRGQVWQWVSPDEDTAFEPR